MEFTAHDLIDIILQIRNPETVKNAGDQILEILNNPQSIELLFEIISIPSTNDFIYQFAIICIRQYIEINHKIINEELLDTIQSNLIGVLKSIRDEVSFSILLEAISTILRLFSSDWPEIQEYAFNVDDSKVIYHIKLLSILIPYFSVDGVIEKMDFFSQFLTSIFESSDINIQCASISLVSKLVIQTKSSDIAEQMRPAVTKLLNSVITDTGYDINLLNKILNPISEVEDYQLRLIDTQYAVKLATNVMIDKSVSDEYRIQLNNLIEICVRNPELKISNDLTIFILSLEFTICRIQYQNEQEDDKFTWTYQITEIIHLIYMRYPNHFIIKNIKNNYDNYHANENEGIRFFQLLLLQYLARSCIPNSEDFLIEIYPKLFQFLSDPSPRFRKYTAITLGFISTRIKDYVKDNMLEILEKINIFVSEFCDEAGSFLLLSLIECASNTDEFIEVEYNFIKEFLCCPNPLICMDAIDIIKCLISNSRSKYILISKDAYSTLTEAIASDISKYSGLLVSLSYLIPKDDDLNDNLNEFISLINEGLNSQDYDVIQNSLTSAQNAIMMYKDKNSEQTLVIIDEILPSIKNINSNPTDDTMYYKIKGSSLYTLSIILHASEMNEEILTYFFECFDSYLQIQDDILTASLILSMHNFLGYVNLVPQNNEMILNNENVQRIISQIIYKIVSENASEFELNESTLVRFISLAIKLFGFQKLNIEPNVIVQFLIYKFNCNILNADELFKESMKSICEALLNILISDSDKQSESDIIGLFSNHLVKLINNDNSSEGQIVAIYAFTLILKDDKLRSLFGDELVQPLIQKIANFIKEANYFVAKSSCKFFFRIIDSNKKSLQSSASEIVENLVLRFNSTDDQSNQSTTLREMLIITICRFYEVFDEIIPINTLLSSLLPVLPLENKIEYAQFIYQFVSTYQNIIVKDEEMTKNLFFIYALVISDRNKESSILNRILLNLMAYFINQHSDIFGSEEEETIACIFQDDEVAYKSFLNLYPKYLSEYFQIYEQAHNIPSNIETIDLTNQTFESDDDQ